ncbi:MAG: cysteine desulfurase [Bacilli bacterium]|nr:cysteine desulfurase [Bacilli bacterium]
MNREDFDMLKQDIIYFDNSATTFKPKSVLNAINDYYTSYTANAHRGDYKISLKVDSLYEGVRDKVKDFINAKSSKEIVFTSGTTDSLNRTVFGFAKHNLKPGDEVIITKTEHASNVLPWLELADEIGIKIKYAPLDKNLKLQASDLLKEITPKTKIVSIAHITNTIGDIRNLKEIGGRLKDKNIYFVVDAAQSAGHRKIDVQDMNIDFLAFSGHKMCGPTGIGVLYGKEELLEKTKPINYGGGMNNFFEGDGSREYRSIPTLFEAGTQNIEGVIGLGTAVDYLNRVGFDKIEEHEKELRSYLIEELSKIENIEILNKESEAGNVLFNIKDVFPQDTAIYLDNYNICVRAGNHCAKLLKDELGIKNTCRISLYLYNTKEEIDKLIQVLKNSKNIFDVVI